MELVGQHPVVDGVHVCVPSDGHAGSFSDEWDRWSTVQVDSCGYRCGYAGCVNSADIFRLKTGLVRADLAGKVVLDAGCGTGRFSEVAAGLGTHIVAVDLSHAVFHAAKLGRAWPGEHTFVQADLERIPLPDASVDVAFSIGVLHHTPHPERAVAEIRRVLRPGGTFAGWVYARQASYARPERAAWRAYATDPAHRAEMLALAQEAPRLRDLFAGSPTRAVAELVRLVPVLAAPARGIPAGMLREIVGISGSRNDAECCLDSFDWMTPRYQWQYTPDEWDKLLHTAGFASVRALQFPVSWIARCAGRL